MRHLDEGTIHAWLDGALDAEESRAVEAHLAECSSCADEVAEARGMIAASSRILSALDTVPGEVLPDDETMAPSVAGAASPSRMPPASGAGSGGAARRRRVPAYVRAAAAVMLVTAGAIAITRVERAPERERVGRAPDRESVRFAPAPDTARAPEAPSMSATPPGAERAAPRAAPSRAPENVPSSGVGPTHQKSGAAVAPAPSAPPAMRKRAAPAPAPRRDYARTEERPAPALAAPEPQAAGAPGGGMSADSASSNALAGKSPIFRLRGESSVVSGEGARVALVAGRVANEVGTPIVHASVVATAGGLTRGALTDSAGRYAIMLPESLANRPVALTARMIGYHVSTETVVPSRTAPVQRDFTLPSNPLTLSEVVVTDQGRARARDSAPALPRPALVRSDTVVEEGRTVRRKIYEVRPGVRVTLEEAAAIADHPAAADARVRGVPSPPAPARAPAQSAESLAVGVNSIEWTAADGTRCRLSGRLPVGELERLREILR